MTRRVKGLVCIVAVGGLFSLWSALSEPSRQWPHFWVYLAAVLLSSGMKVGMPNTDGTMSVNFPFILLGILQLSPLQAVSLAGCSVIAQCNFRVIKSFSLVQIGFNVANVISATVIAWQAYAWLIRHHGEIAPALALASAVYFFANTIPVALIIGLSAGVSPFKQWYEDFPWYLPFYLVGAMLAVAANLISVTFGWLTSLLMIPLVYTIYRAYTAQMAIVRARERQARETEELQLRTIESLAMAIEAKDKSTHDHLLRVRVYVSEVGKKKGLDGDLMKALVTASFLHDIGKLAVPEYIINKPGKLTREEFEKMKIHPSVGADILDRVRFPYPVVPIVRSHHEAWDGSGYPDGLKGEEIPIGARILTAVDCFDALASERPYRKALSLDEAMAHVKSQAGTQFDPEIVAILEGCYLELEEKARHQIEQLKPLDTEHLVLRGAAPGAGFEPEHQALKAGPNQGIPEPQLRGSPYSIAAECPGSSPRDVSAKILFNLPSLVPCDCCALYLKSEDVLLTHFIAGKCAEAFAREPMSIGQGLSGWVAQSGRALVNGNPTVEPTYLEQTALLQPTSSTLAVPLRDAEGNVFGVLTLYSQASAAYSKEHLRMLQEIEPELSLSLTGLTVSRDQSFDAIASPVGA